jgi:hypothetical protein
MKRVVLFLSLVLSTNVVFAQFVDYIPVYQKTQPVHFELPEPPTTVVVEQSSQWEYIGEIRGESEKYYTSAKLEIKVLGDKLIFRVLRGEKYFTLTKNPHRGENNWKGKYNYTDGEYYYSVDL